MPANTAITMTPYTGTPPTGFSYATGTIYYTTDGSDPRGAIGAPAASAAAYSAPVVLASSGALKARLYNPGLGYWSPLSSGTFIVNAVPANAANLVISEIHFQPNAPTNAETAAGYSLSVNFQFIELLNISGQNVDLSHCQFTTGITFDFAGVDPTTLTLSPGGRVLIVQNKNAFLFRYGNNPNVKIAGQFTGSLINSGERIVMLAADASTIADFTYAITEPWPLDAAGSGYSLVLNNPAAGVNYGNGANWRSSAQIGGTPGLANSTPFAGSPNGDTDGDGMKDFAEYATGSDMNNPASKNVPTLTFAPYTVGGTTQTYLRMDYRRNLSADGVNYAAQYSEDMVNWASDATAVTYVGTHNNGDGTATVTYRSTQPVAPARPKMFMRLQVGP